MITASAEIVDKYVAQAKEWLATDNRFNNAKGVAVSAIVEFLLYKDKIENETKK